MVFQGYWNNDVATKEMIDEDGWLHTGDVGALDDEGFLAITGRKKDLARPRTRTATVWNTATR
jgi:long-chain acyl-CoA synthetase